MNVYICCLYLLPALVLHESNLFVAILYIQSVLNTFYEFPLCLESSVAQDMMLCTLKKLAEKKQFSYISRVKTSIQETFHKC